ncbi:MAG: TolC family protein [Bdellovibrio sp.]|nr:TolC family protein [Bdellovibrio sp.]
MKRLFLKLSILAQVLAPTQVLAEPVSITSEALRSLLDAKNIRVSSAKLSQEAAQEREGSLGRSFLPSLELHGAQESFKVGNEEQKSQPTYGAEIKANLYNGGKDQIESDIRRLETTKRSSQSKKILAEELEKARTTYWELRYLQEKMLLLKDTLAVNQQNLNAALRRIKSGVATDSDRFEFEMKDVDLKRELAELEVQIQNNTRILTLLLGLSEGTVLSFPEKLSHDHDYEVSLKYTDKDHEFQYKETQIQAEQDTLAAKSQHREWWPKLDAYASYNQFNEREEDRIDASDRTESVVGLRLSISLPNGFESRREAAAKLKESQASQALSIFAKQEIEANLKGEIAELRVMHDQAHEAEENILRSERYYKLTQSEYARGVKNSPDVLGASEKLFDMKNKRLEILKKFQVAKAHVLLKIGK